MRKNVCHTCKSVCHFQIRRSHAISPKPAKKPYVTTPYRDYSGIDLKNIGTPGVPPGGATGGPSRVRTRSLYDKEGAI